MYKCIIFLFVCLFIICCGNNQKKNEYPAIDVIGYIKGQLKLLDSIPYGILKVTELQGGRTDSVYIKKNELPGILKSFLSESISKTALEINYEEKSFADAGNQMINITYDAKDKEAVINQITIYVNPSDGNIRLLYINGFFESAGRPIKKQLLWTHNKGFQIISSEGSEHKEGNLITEKYIWQ